MQRKKKSRLPLLAFVVFATYLYFNQEPDLTAPQVNQEPDSVVPQAEPQPGYATTIKAKAWPPLSEQSGPVLPEARLTTKNYYVVFDGSGSMGGSSCTMEDNKLYSAKGALAHFAAGLPRDAQIGMLAFDATGLSERVSLQPYDQNIFDRAVAAVTADGGTPLSRAITLAHQQLTAQAKLQLGYGEYHLVVVTDGEANEGEEPNAVVDQILAESPVIIHTIGFCIDQRHSLNQPGRVRYLAADNDQALQQGLESVLAEAPEFEVISFE